MTDPTIWKLITDYGIAIVGLIFFSRFLMWLIKYILERNKQREDVILQMLTSDIKHLSDAMSTLTLNLTNFTQTVTEAHRFQREEHIKMIDALNKICLTTEKK